MKKGNLTNRDCYTEYCDWDISGIIEYIEMVYEDSPEIGLENIIARTWEKAGVDIIWVSLFEHNKKTAKFPTYNLEHRDVMDCECRKSKDYYERIKKLETIDELFNSRKNPKKIELSLIKYFGQYSVAKTLGVPNPYYQIKRRNINFLFLDKSSKLYKKFMKAKGEEKKLINKLKKQSYEAGVSVYE